MKLKKILTYFALLSGSISYSQEQQKWLIDSLEARIELVESDWEKLDLAVGLNRLYQLSNRPKEADWQLEFIYSLKEKIPSAEAYGLIMENIRAYNHEGDDDKSIAKCLEAISVSKEIGDNNTLAYARYQLGENYIFEKGDAQKALDLLLTSISELDETVSLKTWGNTYKTLGFVYGFIGDYEKGHFYLNESLIYLKKLIDDPPVHPKTGKPSAQNAGPEIHLINAYNYIGDIYKKEGNTTEGIDVKLKGLFLAKEINNRDMVAFMNEEIGKLYLSIGKLEQALACLQTSREMFEEMGMEKDIKVCNTQLIDIHIIVGEYDRAEKYLNENIQYYLEKQDSTFLAATYLQGIRLYFRSDQNEKAISLLNKAQPIADNMNMVENKAMIQRMRGNLALKSEDFPGAIVHFKTAIKLFQSEESMPEIARVKLEIAESYHLLQEYDSALTYAKRSLEDANNQKDLDLARDVYQLKSEIIGASGNFKDAYQLHKQFFKLHDSLYAANAQAKLKEEQVRQDVVSYRNEKELAEQNAALLEKQNRTYIAVGIIIFVVLLLIAYLYLNLRKVKFKIQSQNEQLTQLNQTKDKFFGIIAHDLRSPLIGLQGVGDQVDYFLKKGKTDRLNQVSKSISDTTKRLNELLDNLLSWALLQNGMIPYHPQKVDVKKSVDSIMDLLAPLSEMKEVKLSNEIQKDAFVYADEKSREYYSQESNF